MHPRSVLLASFALSFVTAVVFVSCAAARGSSDHAAVVGGPPLGSQTRYDLVMTSEFCGGCHTATYAEHTMNTHGRAFTDQEVRLATGNFETGDCIRCHTPRPIFETGNGMNPQRRFHGLEEGNTCMTCHWRQDVDYSRFTGGADCIGAFDPRVGEVEACGACHKNHGTPYQWEQSPNGKEAGRTCVTCHMKQVEREIAVGGPVRRVRSHVFPGARDEAHVRRAYDYTARVDGNEVVVEIANTGAGHNFPTELRQRSVESLVVVRDAAGTEVSRSRMVFRDPYRRPYGMHLPTNKQIPSGESRVHRVPLKVAGGTVDCELHFKLYFPIEDNHPDLSRRLELQRLVFEGVEPSAAEVTTDPETEVATPEGIDPRVASPGDLGEMANAPLGTVTFEIPPGDSEADIARLVGLFNFQIPEANRKAVRRLAEIGMPAVPQLIRALGSWDNKTFNQAMKVLRLIGAPALPAVRAALRDDELYVRLHARQLLRMMPLPADVEALTTEVLPGLSMPNALDRCSAVDVLARLRARSALPAIRALLAEYDADVVRSAALALAAMDDRGSLPAIAAARDRIAFAETKIDLGWAMARLGDRGGIDTLLQGLDHRDDLIRETCFERFFSVTGQHLGFEVFAPHEERLAAIARLHQWWAKARAGFTPLPPLDVAAETDDHALHVVLAMGGGAGIVPAATDDEQAIAELTALGRDALPALIKGLKFPPGFATKRASVLATFGRIGDRHAAPFVAAVLRDPVFGVAHWAASVLETCGDEACLPALHRFEARVRAAAAARQLPASIPSPDPLLAASARTRLLLGDASARTDLVALLTSPDATARLAAIRALEQKHGEDRGYSPDAEPAERLRAAARWRD
jgi:HEAT repeat protein